MSKEMQTEERERGREGCEPDTSFQANLATGFRA